MKELFEKIQTKHKMRFYKSQKQGFRDLIIDEFNQLGYENISIDKAKNVIIGDPSKSKVVYSAHYDTPPFTPHMFLTKIFGQFTVLCVLIFLALLALIFAIAPFDFIPRNFYFLYAFFLFILFFFIPNPNNANDNTSGILAVYHTAKILKEQGREKDTAFIFFNSEEPGLLGSGYYVKDYKKTFGEKPKFVLINYDCVGIGNNVLITFKTKKSKELALELSRNFSQKVVIKKASLFAFGSDNQKFENGVMIAATKKALLGRYYLPRIHALFNKKIDLKTVEEICSHVIQSHEDRK